MKNTLILLFLILSYNFLLWYITTSGLSPIPLFPQDIYNTMMVITYNSVLFIAWFFGERNRVFLWIGYLFFLQIVALSVVLGELRIVVQNLSPVILTFALIALFESPTEREIREIVNEREKLLREIDRILGKRKKIEASLVLLIREIQSLEKEREKAELSKQEKSELERKLVELQEEVRKLKDKEQRLLESNRKLFELLEHIKEGEGGGKRKGELSSLRRERKKLIKEIIQNQELLSLYSQENEILKKEIDTLKQELQKVRRELEVSKLSREKDRSVNDRALNLLKDFLITAFGIEISDRVIRELMDMAPDRRRSFLKEISRLRERLEQGKLSPLATLPRVYKVRFSGGRLYVRRKGELWEVVGALDSEDDKDKDRYINEVLSKIV